MIRNYFKTAWRNLLKNKVFSLINILGLTVGITACILLFLYILNEFSVDRFHADANRTYRVMRGFKAEGETKNVAYLSGMYAAALVNDFEGQVESAIRINQNDNLVAIGERSFREKRVINADSNFFTFFTFPLLQGNPKTALSQPGNVVLTETTAKKYFGSTQQAMGKLITVDKELQLTVTGIAKDVSSDSHLEFDLVIPIQNYRNSSWMTVWGNNGLYTYIKLTPGTSQAQVEKHFPAFMDKYMGSYMRQHGFDFSLSLTPLNDVYFNNASFDGIKHGDKTVVYIFLSIAVLILLIACINFINLSTIRAAERSKEVGLRKALGAERKNVIGQFLGESVLLVIISCTISVVLVVIALPWYNQFLGYSLSSLWANWPIYLFLVGVIFIAGLLSGAYPAFFLSSFAPIQALKGRFNLGKSGSVFRQALVVVQFSISVILIVGTIVMTKQMNYVKNRQLGYAKEQTLLIPIDNGDIYRNMYAFKRALQNESRIQTVAMMSGEPGGYFDGHMFSVQGHDEKWNARTEFTDFEFVEALGLKMAAGRDFSAAFPTDSSEAVLINEKAAEKLGWTAEQAVGKWIQNSLRDSTHRTIVGVVKDFNFQSLKKEIEPLVISPNTDRRVIVIRLKPGDLRAGVASVENTYKKFVTGYPLEYSFLDQQFDQMYRKDIKQQIIMLVFSSMAIFVACLGLFGLASFAAIKRLKEIGVRKVLGSSVQSIVILLSRDLLRPVIIATFISIPVGYWATNKWLQGFAFKTTLNWWVFFAAALATFAIAFLTIGIKAMKAASANPIKSLRAE